MQILDPWESHFREWKREKEEREANAPILEKNHQKLMEFERVEVEDVKEAKKKEVYHILGLMYQRKRMILLLLAILAMAYLFLTLFY